MFSVQRPDYDIIVIGAGPAGANFARLLDTKRYRILVIDGSEGHDKVCGGLISPDAQYILAKYDISLPREVLATPQLFSVRTVDLGTGLTRYYRRNYLNADRKRLDRFSAIRSRLMHRCARAAVRISGGQRTASA